MDRLHLPSTLDDCQRILLAGAGGGFDIYAAIPLLERLRSLGKDVFLANLSFTELSSTTSQQVTAALFQVTPEDRGENSYFPERTLVRFLSKNGYPHPVFAFEKTGVAPTLEGYLHLVLALNLDAVVLVDGGTDILLRGNERNLGTPVEDMVSLAAVSALPVKTRLVACVGFGIDSFHGVCHANWLENVATLTSSGGFLGAQALTRHMPEVRTYIDAVIDAERETPHRQSIVNGSIVSAIEGQFGNYHRHLRTAKQNLFINPLMTFLWLFDLPAVARQNLYLDQLQGTTTIREVERLIEEFHASIAYRPVETIPH